ncbi:MAG: pyridoxamine 5'-phosphate oxidase family protein [Proteobacteria bacterium]|nr:pyridoxamine 5'-phosphate oxidase family protein [Pseudomonadota bacterium]
MERLLDLDAIEAELWSQLERAPRERGHGWRVGVLATGDGAGGADARSVVLRDVDRARRALIFYADSRSAKVRQIAARPQGTLVLWSPALSWQLRLRVTLAVRTNGLAVSSRWARLKMTPGAQDYLSPLPPGSPIDAPLPERGSREHFGVVTAVVDAVDWLELHADGHRRAGFDGRGRRWLVP